MMASAWPAMHATQKIDRKVKFEHSHLLSLGDLQIRLHGLVPLITVMIKLVMGAEVYVTVMNFCQTINLMCEPVGRRSQGQ